MLVLVNYTKPRMFQY